MANLVYYTCSKATFPTGQHDFADNFLWAYQADTITTGSIFFVLLCTKAYLRTALRIKDCFG